MRQAEPVSTTSSAKPAALSSARTAGAMKAARLPQPTTSNSVGTLAWRSAARPASDRSSARVTFHAVVAVGVTSTGPRQSRSLMTKWPGP